MKIPVLAAATLYALTASGPASATPVDAFAFLQVEHGYIINAGGVPAGISSSVSGPSFQLGLDSGIDSVDAAVTVDEVDTVVGNAVIDAPTPFLTTRRYRVARTDPTEFAEGNNDISILSVQDSEANVFALGQRDLTRSGLAQVRITSSPAESFALSEIGISRITTFENETRETTAFNIRGYFDAFLLASFNGEDGFARAATTIDILFDGIDADALTYVPLDTYVLDIDDSAPGATVTEGLFADQPGTVGLRFTAGATALGAGGLTEASLDAGHEYILRLALGPGETALMTTAFSQNNAVEYTPLAAPVPLPAGFVLLGSAVALLPLMQRRGARRARCVAHPDREAVNGSPLDGEAVRAVHAYRVNLNQPGLHQYGGTA